MAEVTVKMKAQLIFLLLLALTAVTPFASATHPLVSDDAGIQGKGNWQLELNTDRYHYQSQAASQAAAITMTYGALENLDVYIGPGVFLSPHAGIGDASIGFKWRIGETNGLTWGVKNELTLPLGNSEKHFGYGRANLALTLLGAYSAGRWTVLGNFGMASNRYGLAEDQATYRRSLWRSSAAIIYSIDEEFRIAADAGVRRSQENGERRTPAFMLVGVIYSPRQSMDLDAGIKFGLNRAEVQRQVGVGLTLRF